jgi:hypothetical protein
MQAITKVGIATLSNDHQEVLHTQVTITRVYYTTHSGNDPQVVLHSNTHSANDHQGILHSQVTITRGTVHTLK